MHKILTPIQTLLLGFVFLIILGALLLSLPVSAVEHRFIPFLDAFFTAATSVTTEEHQSTADLVIFGFTTNRMRKWRKHLQRHPSLREVGAQERALIEK